MNKKLSKEELLKIADSGLADLSCDQLKELIKKESEKDYENIDTDYIDTCFELLSIKQNNNSGALHKTKVRKLPIKKALLFAAVFTVFIVTAVTATAQIHLNIPESIVQLTDGEAVIYNNLENADSTANGYALLNTDLARALAANDITPVTFPEEMIKEDCIITQTQFNPTDDLTKYADIDFEYKGFNGSLHIIHETEYTETASVSGVMDVKSGQMLNINGMDILIFEQENDCIIEYKNNLTNYSITLYCDLEAAIEFAESIK